MRKDGFMRESTKTLVGSTESNAENLLKNKKCILLPPTISVLRIITVR